VLHLYGRSWAPTPPFGALQAESHGKSVRAVFPLVSREQTGGSKGMVVPPITVRKTLSLVDESFNPCPDPRT
jgi:hypothetical protein